MYPKRAQTLLEYVVLTGIVVVVVVMFSGDFFGKMLGNEGAFTKHFRNMSERMQGMRVH
jgi:uncharacterized protein (UPF0333 family)